MNPTTTDDRDELTARGCRLLSSGEVRNGAELALAKIIARIPHRFGDGEILVVRVAVWKPGYTASGYTSRVALYAFNNRAGSTAPHSFSIRHSEIEAVADALDDVIDLGQYSNNEAA